MATTLPLQSRTFEAPTAVVVEASWDVILDQNLDTLEGEHFDRIDAVISITVDPDTITLETVRTHAAWRRGEANAGRGTWTFPRSAIAALHTD